MDLRVPSFEATRILVVGDAMLDRYWHGTSSRISPEAPVPVVEIREVEDRPGGAANVALNLASLGAQVRLLAMIGADEAGHVLQTKLESAGVRCRFWTSAARPTTMKLRIVSHHQQMIRADFESGAEIDQSWLSARLDEFLPGLHALLLSDYDKGVLGKPEEIIRAARRTGVPALVDPKFKPFDLYRGATLIKPNRVELERAVGAWRSESDMIDRAQQLMLRLDLEALLVTRAEQGMTLLRPGMPELHFPARTREVADVSGAGDTVIAVLAAALSAGQSLPDAVGLANVAAGVTCSHRGIVSITAPELRREVASITGLRSGVLTEEQLLIAVEDARHCRERIVFTNGCFDILHAGHVDYLAEAKSLGDRLIVAVNDDASVARLKGEGRPINQIDRRMTMLAGLTSVDWVVAFPDDTPERLLQKIRPDVLVKGGDYGVEQVVGADIVRGYGGEVRVVGLVEGCSTSNLVERIRGR